MRLGELQQTRKDLMTELEELMKVLKVQPGPPASHQAAKFTQKISRNQTNISSQLRPYGSPGRSGGFRYDSDLQIRIDPHICNDPDLRIRIDLHICNDPDLRIGIDPHICNDSDLRIFTGFIKSQHSGAH